MKRWTVGDVMTRDVVSVGADTTYHDLVRILAEHGISAVPVVDANGGVAGVVSEADLLHKVEFSGAAEPPKVFEGKAARRARVKSAADKAGDLMSAPAVTVTSETPLADAAKLVDKHDIKRLPVVDSSGRLVGIVSRTDLLRSYLRTDDQIARDIREQVLAQTLGVDPNLVTVAVEGGEVHLGGKVDRQTTAVLIARLCAAVAGVTEVRDELTWEFDDSKITDPTYYRAHPFSGPQPQ